MAKIRFSRQEFEKEVKITPEIETKINLFGTPLESLTSSEIEIEIFPNRPELLSLQGYLRAFKAFIGKETGLKKYKIHKPEKNYKVKVEPDVKNVRPFTVCAIVKNIKLNDEKIKEIINLQEKLHTTIGRNRKKMAIGIYPLEKIKLPITYTAKKPEAIKFQPLESQKEMSGKQILEKHPAGRKYAYLLEGADKYPVFLDANKKVLSMPPIVNSHETGKVDLKTKEVFIECSGFDLNSLEKTLNIISTMLADLGGAIYQMGIIDKEKMITPNLSPEKMRISLEKTNRILGLDLKERDLEKLLPKMGYNYKSGLAEVPAWRTDVLHEIDIIEDIAIAYGYDKIRPEIPSLSTIAEESKESKLKRKISELLIGLGMLEISTHHLIKESESEKINQKDKIEVENSKTEYKILRPNLKIPMLRVLSENVDAEYPQKLFEIGRVFKKDEKSETDIHESNNLIVALSPANFTDIKQCLDYLLKSFQIDWKMEENHENDLIDGRAGKIIMDKEELGYIGEVHPSMLKKAGLKMPLALFEINLDKIFEIIN